MASFKWPSSGGGSGTVTSIAFADGSTSPIFSISGSPITTNGTITETLVTQSANTIFAGPSSGSAAQPTFRALVTGDLPFSIGNLTDAGTDGIAVTGGTGAVIGSGTSIAQHVADTTHNGYLSSTDWNTFNGKQSSLTIGNLTDAGTDGIIITGGTGAIIGSGTSIAQTKADATHNGYLSSSDWTAFSSTSNAMTTLGDIIYENATPAPARLAGNTTATKNFLTQTGTGSISAVPAWGTIVSGDLPADVAYVDVNNVFTAFQTSSYAGIASHGALTLTGSPFTGGNSVTTKPQLLLEDAGTSSGWSTSGTYLGINCKTGFSGNAFQVSQNGVSGMTIGATGVVTTPSCTATEVIVGATGILGPNNATLLIGTGRSFSSANSVHQIIDNGQADTASSGTSVSVAITPTWNQTSTANATDLLINRTETAAPNTQLFFSCQVSGSTKYAIDHTGLVTTGTWGGTSFAGNSAILKAPTTTVLTTTGSQTGLLFTVSSANATVGATYTNNGNTYTVQGTISAGTLLFMSGTGTTSGSTLTKATGTGDATITFSSHVGTATYTLPTGPSPLYLKVRMAGGGGGGGGSSSLSAGDGGAANGGLASVFGTNLLNAGGGSFGNGSSSNTSAGGTASLGVGPTGFSFSGGASSGGGVDAVSNTVAIGGSGGNNAFGGGGGSSNGNGAIGAAAVTNTGGGGGGASAPQGTSGGEGGAGGGAGAYIDATISGATLTGLGASTPYIVGTGGSAGAAGTSGAHGGAGAAGIIIIEEHYQ